MSSSGTRQLRKANFHWGALRIFQLDQSCKAAARDLGIHLFQWGSLLEGYQVCVASLWNPDLIQFASCR